MEDALSPLSKVMSNISLEVTKFEDELESDLRKALKDMILSPYNAPSVPTLDVVSFVDSLNSVFEEALDDSLSPITDALTRFETLIVAIRTSIRAANETFSFELLDNQLAQNLSSVLSATSFASQFEDIMSQYQTIDLSSVSTDLETLCNLLPVTKALVTDATTKLDWVPQDCSSNTGSLCSKSEVIEQLDTIGALATSTAVTMGGLVDLTTNLYTTLETSVVTDDIVSDVLAEERKAAAITASEDPLEILQALEEPIILVHDFYALGQVGLLDVDMNLLQPLFEEAMLGDSWEKCGDEGDTCSCQTMLRFGFSDRSTNRTWSDPLPMTSRQLECEESNFLNVGGRENLVPSDGSVRTCQCLVNPSGWSLHHGIGYANSTLPASQRKTIFPFNYYRHSASGRRRPAHIGSIPLTFTDVDYEMDNGTLTTWHEANTEGYEFDGNGTRRSSYADRLGRFVSTVLEATGSERVNLVCHGMGGVVCRAWMKWLGGLSKVRRLVTIGTPNNGLEFTDDPTTQPMTEDSVAWQLDGELIELSACYPYFCNISAGGTIGQCQSYTQWLNESWAESCDEHGVLDAAIVGSLNSMPWNVRQFKDETPWCPLERQWDGDGVTFSSSAELPGAPVFRALAEHRGQGHGVSYLTDIGEQSLLKAGSTQTAIRLLMGVPFNGNTFAELSAASTWSEGAAETSELVAAVNGKFSVWLNSACQQATKLYEELSLIPEALERTLQAEPLVDAVSSVVDEVVTETLGDIASFMTASELVSAAIGADIVDSELQQYSGWLRNQSVSLKHLNLTVRFPTLTYNISSSIRDLQTATQNALDSLESDTLAQANARISEVFLKVNRVGEVLRITDYTSPLLSTWLGASDARLATSSDVESLLASLASANVLTPYGALLGEVDDMFVQSLDPLAWLQELYSTSIDDLVTTMLESLDEVSGVMSLLDDGKDAAITIRTNLEDIETTIDDLADQASDITSSSFTSAAASLQEQRAQYFSEFYTFLDSIDFSTIADEIVEANPAITTQVQDTLDVITSATDTLEGVSDDIDSISSSFEDLVERATLFNHGVASADDLDPWTAFAYCSNVTCVQESQRSSSMYRSTLFPLLYLRFWDLTNAPLISSGNDDDVVWSATLPGLLEGYVPRAVTWLSTTAQSLVGMNAIDDTTPSSYGVPLLVLMEDDAVDKLFTFSSSYDDCRIRDLVLSGTQILIGCASGKILSLCEDDLEATSPAVLNPSVEDSLSEEIVSMSANVAGDSLYVLTSESGKE